MIQAETLDLLEWYRLCQHLSTFAATKLGAIASRQLQLPTTKEESLTLLSQTQEVYQLEQRPNGRLSFEGITDIGNALERANIGGMLIGQELLSIATTLAGVRRLRRIIDQQEDCPVLNALVEQVRTYPDLEQEIYRCIEEDGTVADRASPQLREVRGQMKVVRERIYRRLQEIINKQGGAVQEAVITQRSDRFVIPVKAPQKDQIPGIIHDTSSTGATIYVEPQSVVEQGNKLRQFRRTEQIEEEIILRKLSEQVASLFDDLEYLLAVATTIDLATARARYSLWLEAHPPRFVNLEAGEQLTLRQLRHPLLVWQQQHEQGRAVIPINVQILAPIRVVAITGPNTGGKTVTLKTFGLAALMAKAGLFIPAKEPVEIPWFDQILADIGDEQSLQQSLSTFSGHIRRIVRILEALQIDNSSSLVLLDEVGAGTDPAEGSALAIALLKYLAENVTLSIATTHYGELKALKYQDSRFENASVEFDDQTISPTYRLLWGIPGRSNALTIAQRLGLDPEIVEDARSRVGGYTEDINQVIAGLEQQRKEQEQKAFEAKKLLQQTEKFYTEVSQKATSLQEREKDLKRTQEIEIQKALTNAKTEIAKVIRQLQQGTPTAQDAQKATQALNEISAQFLPNTSAKPQKTYIPKVGERVRIPSLGQTAEVLSVSEDTGNVSVKFGLMKMTINFTEIESLDGQKVEILVKAKATPVTPPPSQTEKPPTLIQTSKNTIDIRGSRVAEAEADLEKAIAQATQSGVLWVIHGKGTGKLRQGVHEFLGQHPQVKRFEIAPQNEGGSGVTIVYLR
ncbi:endonuclease MutS2 [Aphanothece hegewaldii CCALA 016]|uniref:Endonuclease MutS2 n=1 Tax=Aphanothece hegewaldii CCALA 016 TaxID=2107694 RepID=A0A2T1LXG6_9CHRO|nr:endonuclease MutS2 [Aphanothece hegewaldii]PSF37069.1 endonuclease MutS2 [Aphanothece hegewaldii CCALA 016]